MGPNKNSEEKPQKDSKSNGEDKSRGKNWKQRYKGRDWNEGYTTKNLKFKYARHVIRSEGVSWAERMITWRPFDRKRTKGKPLCDEKNE